MLRPVRKKRRLDAARRFPRQIAHFEHTASSETELRPETPNEQQKPGLSSRAIVIDPDGDLFL
jgi:hypothetical protein